MRDGTTTKRRMSVSSSSDVKKMSRRVSTFLDVVNHLYWLEQHTLAESTSNFNWIPLRLVPKEALQVFAETAGT